MLKSYDSLIDNDIEYLLVNEILGELENNIRDSAAYINNFEWWM